MVQKILVKDEFGRKFPCNQLLLFRKQDLGAVQNTKGYRLLPQLITQRRSNRQFDLFAFGLGHHGISFSGFLVRSKQVLHWEPLQTPSKDKLPSILGSNNSLSIFPSARKLHGMWRVGQ